MKKKKKNDFFNIFGLSSILLVSFYFYEFSYFSVPDAKVIILELFKIFSYLFIIIFIFIKFNKYKFENYILFFFLIYILIFVVKLLFNASGSLTLHSFLENFYKLFFTYHPGNKPIFLTLLSYTTPFLFISIILLLLNKHLDKIKNFLSIFGIVLLFLMFYDLSQIYYKNYISLSKNIKNLDSTNSNKKILWILYDGLDPEFIDIKVGDNKVFKNLNNLRSSGVFHSDMYPPAEFTINSMPAQLMGINIKKNLTRHRTLIFKDLNDKEIPFTFENSIFGKLHNSNARVSLISSVLEYCSMYLISFKWTNCDDLISTNKQPDIFYNSLKFYFSIVFKSKNILEKLGILEIEKNKIVIKSDNSMPNLKFKDLNFEKLDQIDFDKDNFYADHYNLININKVIKYFNSSEMTYLHVYNPHLLPFSEKHILDNYKIKNYIGDGYLLKYLYVDHFTKNIVNQLKQINNKNILIIISSDHWHRTKSNSDKKNAFFLAKILNDDISFEILTPSNSIIIPGLIQKFYNGKINSNKDIYEYIEKVNVVINTKFGK